ncbi:MAG: hypothetical protein ABI358_07880 [Ginsengibacter sp.]
MESEYLFATFTINRIEDVDEMTLLDESAIPPLCALKDHIDLYSQKLG